MAAVLYGRFKRGDSHTFRTITVRDSNDTPIDLTQSGWSARIQLRPNANNGTYVELAIASVGLATGQVVASITPAQSKTMEPGTWVGDIEVVGPDGTRSSDTFEVEVVADVTQPVVAP